MYFLIKDDIIVDILDIDGPFINPNRIPYDSIITSEDNSYIINETYIGTIEYDTNPRPALVYPTSTPNVMSPVNVAETNTAPGPLVYLDITTIYSAIRVNKYLIDSLQQIGVNTTQVKSTATKELLTVTPEVLKDKQKFNALQKELNIPSLNQYSFDKATILSLTTPLIIKPINGKGGFAEYNFVYKIFMTATDLILAVETELPTAWQDLLNSVFVEEAVVESDSTTNKIVVYAMINGDGKAKYLPLDRQIWGAASKGVINMQCSKDPFDYPDSSITDNLDKLFSKVGLKNCGIYIQAVVKNGIPYWNDTDVRIPVIYAKAYNEYLNDHLKYVLDMQQDFTVMPSKYVKYKVIEHIPMVDVDASRIYTVLATGANTVNGFFWIQSQNSAQQSRGSYLIMGIGTTAEEAASNLDAYENYVLTTTTI